MLHHKPQIAGAAGSIPAPHSNGEASAPNLPDHSHGPLANNRAATGEAGVAPFSSVSPTLSDQWRNPPDCKQCGRGMWRCACEWDEPQAEWREDRRDPDLHRQAMQSEVRL